MQAAGPAVLFCVRQAADGRRRPYLPVRLWHVAQFVGFALIALAGEEGMSCRRGVGGNSGG